MEVKETLSEMNQWKNDIWKKKKRNDIKWSKND